MSESTYSFVYDRESAAQAFEGVGARDLVLAMLAGVSVDTEWTGCEVYRGESPLGVATVCVGTRGAGGDEVQRLLVEAMERQEIKVLQVYEGGPGVAEPIAKADAGRWVVG